MNQKYTPVADRLVPIPIVEEPKRGDYPDSCYLPSGDLDIDDADIFDLQYEEELNAYKTYKELTCPLIINKKDFKQGEEYELDKDFRTRYKYYVLYETDATTSSTVSFVADSLDDCYKQFEAKLGKPEPQIIDIHSELVAIPIQTDKGVEHLLVPRRKVVMDYPDSPYEVGEILICNLGTDWYDKYPAIFKKLEWWEERNLEEMPSYMKWQSGAGTQISRVERWEFKKGYYSFWIKTDNSEDARLDIEGGDFPATKEEYETQIK